MACRGHAGRPLMEWLGYYLALGAFVGFFAGMLGIGGGGVMVPLLVWLLEAQGMPRDTVLHLSVGTSMATILFTSASSVRAHSARGAVRWDIAWRMTPGILIGGLVGSAIANVIPTVLFAALFTVMVYAASGNMLIDRKPTPSRTGPGPIGASAVGFGISAVSAFAAIGGAFITVPFMLYCNVPMMQAIGTAAVVGFPIALAGTVGFIVGGWGSPVLPAWSLGYVYLPALAGITVASVLFAPLGAMAAHKLPTKILKRIFAVLLFVFATKMLVGML